MNPKAMLSKIKKGVTSEKGHSIFTFLIFLLIATIFWFLMTLNETVQRDYRLEVSITDVPQDVSFLNQPPQYIDVSVRDKGRALIKYDWGTPPKVNIKYSYFIKKGDIGVVINQEMLTNNIRSSFGSGCEILSIRPDSIRLITTTRPGEKLPVFLDISVGTQPQYAAYGDFKCDFDSVTVYSLNGLPETMSNISTEHISLRNMSETTTINIPLIAPQGMRCEPSHINVTIPIESLVAKKRIIPVQLVNVPGGISAHIFPATIEVNYLVPMSMFKNDNTEPIAVVDFNNIDENSSMVPVTLTQIPDYYYNSVCNPSEVEYLIEQSITVADTKTAENNSSK
ncbi:MAG: hypothetical protein K2L73_01245 [Muribaculaceae bacterium]|nr:hypothetical protein [Muribaculaceae bacterium]